MIIVTVRPWGYVYMNGTRVGRAPPRVLLKDVADGVHRIEIRNESGAAYNQMIRVGKGQTVHIEHAFRR